MASSNLHVHNGYKIKKFEQTVMILETEKTYEFYFLPWWQFNMFNKKIIIDIELQLFLCLYKLIKITL